MTPEAAIDGFWPGICGIARHILLAVALSLYANGSTADPARLDVPAVVISADHAPEAFPAADSQTTISREQLESARAADIHAPLYGASGTTLIQSKAYGVSGITLRGASGGLGLITFDGVPVFANFAGFYSLRHFSGEVVEDIRVQRGFDPQVSNSRTLGGTIHLQSRRVDDGKTHLRLEGGSQQTLNASLAAGWGRDKDNATLVVGRTVVSNGDTQSGVASPVADHDNYRMGRTLLRAEKSFERGSFQASAYYVKAHEDTDGPGLTPDFKVAWLEDPNGWFSDEVLITQANATLDITDNWQSRLQLGYTRDRQNGRLGTFRPLLPIGPFSMDLTSELALADWQNTHWTASRNGLLASLQWGFSAQHQQGETAQNNLHESQTLVSPNLGFGLAGDEWSVRLSSRWDHYREDSGHVLYTIGGEWRFLPAMTLWANAGKRLRAPGVNERLHPLFGNRNLQPERNAGGEIGWRWQADADTRIELSGYRQHVHDLIVLALNPATGAVRPNNIADVETSGAELSLSRQWSSRWRSTINYSYMDAENRQTGRAVAVRPQHRLNLINDWQISRPLGLRVELNAHDGFWFDAGNTLWSGSVVRVNALLNYRLTENSQIYLRADNLTNDKTAELYSFNYPHRSFYLGAELDF